ncbi:BQ5605_C005g03251 [Microbotryum silenes-dioicae]|uniref:BQ5605_C005g03251 protein n=1 Tax=Microbotryum silenes-dioicae TaxID=796604 RepID=A0A2X0MDG4_9BASI|nr:BQ5605_C005g03251 [Microbotryum silenes-dioicae]
MRATLVLWAKRALGPHPAPTPTPTPTTPTPLHGSLARAGKVRSQTPKVAPQEKKKKVCPHPRSSRAVNSDVDLALLLAQVCGRAKKRIRAFTIHTRSNSRLYADVLTSPSPSSSVYNRRFVNVTLAPGGKRRMNPNPEGKSGST